MLIKVKGLVIRESKVGESDKYLTLLTSEYGKIYARARGVRSLRSKNMTSAQLLAYSEFTLLKTESFTKVNEAVLLEDFYNLRFDPGRFALAVYIADLASSLAVESQNHDEGLLPLTLNALHALSNTGKAEWLIKGAFELRSVGSAGFAPDLSGCAVCGSDEAESYALNLIEGRLVCSSCSRRAVHGGADSPPLKAAAISAQTAEAMIYALHAPAERLFAFALSGGAQSEFSRACEGYALEQIGHGFDTLTYYKNFAAGFTND